MSQLILLTGILTSKPQSSKADSGTIETSRSLPNRMVRTETGG
jgi:hypothetical protein